MKDLTKLNEHWNDYVSWESSAGVVMDDLLDLLPKVTGSLKLVFGRYLRRVTKVHIPTNFRYDYVPV